MSSDRQGFHICLRHGLQSHSRAPPLYLLDRDSSDSLSLFESRKNNVLLCP